MDSFTLNKIDFDSVRHILASLCRCSLGKHLAIRIGPSRNPAVIRQWLEQVTQMVAAIRDVGVPPFGGITDITAPLERATPSGGATAEDFVLIAGTLEGAMAVRNYLNALPEELPLLRELAGGIGEFQGEIDAVRSIIDPDGTVSDRASERLAEVRRQIVATTQQIHDLIHSYVRQGEVAKLLQEAVVTLHGDRYVLPVKAENRGRLPGVVHRASHSGQTVFVEPEACVQLNNHLTDLAEDERREIGRLLSQLSLRVSAVAEPIHATLRNLAQIDVLTAKAQYAYQFNFTCPEVSERGPLVFNQARHPLLIERAHRASLAISRASLAISHTRPAAAHEASEKKQDEGETPATHTHSTAANAAAVPPVPAVVPIDVRLGQDFDVLVITGSNTGGKTVTLKTVALLVVMAQSGMHIPVQRGAVMPAYRDVFIDIGDEQSLEQSLSTFGAHVKRVRYILRKADPACLVLLDELGSGTDPDEGGAIGQAILDEVRHIGCQCMVTTHLSVLKAYAYANARVDNASVAFDTETLRPTYHLLIGTPGESHAVAVAAHLGMPRRIIGAARQYINQQGKQFRRAIQATSLVRQDAEEARTAANEAALAAKSQQEVYESKLADLHRLQEEFNTWLAGLGELKQGDEVFVPSLGKKGHLVRLEFHRQLAIVDADQFQIEVPLRELMPDLGQDAVREQINVLRRQILDQVGAGEEAMEQARRVQQEYEHSLHAQKERARQFDMWLGLVGRVKVGDEVSIALRPGRGTLSELDFTRLKAKVQTHEGELEISIQDLFPQSGPFAPRHPRVEHPQGQRQPQRRPQGQPHGGGQRERRGQGQAAPATAGGREGETPSRRMGGTPMPRAGETPATHTHAGPGGQGHGQPHEDTSAQPMIRRSPESRSARESHDKLLAVKPGQQVYVVPFHKRATLIRINLEKEQAVVQSGVFELELPLADLEPVKD